MTTKLIGKGAFTRAYRLETGRVLLKSCCPIKEAMAAGWFPDSPRFPKITYIDLGVYEMDYYPRVVSLKNVLEPREWEFYQALRRIDAARGKPGSRYDNYSFYYALFEGLAADFPEESVDLLEALDACSNYGSDIGFECSPRNVTAVGGKLVLLDVFFSISKLLEVRKCKS